MRVILALALCGCSELVYLPPVDAPGATEIFMIGDEGAARPSTVEWIDLAGDFSVRGDLDGHSRFEALILQETPEMLGLTEEWNFPATAFDANLLVYRGFVATTSSPAWQEARTSWSSAATFPVPCDPVGERWGQPLEAGVGIIGLVPRPDGSAIVVTRNSVGVVAFQRADARGLTALPGKAEETFDSAFAGSDGAMYLGGAGKYARGDPESGFTIISVNSSSSARMLASDASGDVIFGLSEDNVLYQVQGSIWTELARFDATIELPPSGAVQAISATEAYVVSLDARAIHHFVDGQMMVEPTDIDDALESGDDRLESLRYAPGLGTFAGAGGRVLQRSDDGKWHIIRNARTVMNEVDVLLPVGNALFVSGDENLDEYYHGVGFCEEDRVALDNFLADFGAPIAGGFVLAGIQIISDTEKQYLVTALHLVPF